MPTELLYDNSYTGPRFTYGLTYRPAGIGSVPAGRICLADRSHDAFRFGTIDYATPLTAEQIESFQLTDMAEYAAALTRRPVLLAEIATATYERCEVIGRQLETAGHLDNTARELLYERMEICLQEQEAIAV